MSDGIPKIPSRRNQDPAHVMNLPSLNMGYEPCSKKDITIVDLDIQVYGLEEIQGSTKPVVAIVSGLGWAPHLSTTTEVFLRDVISPSDR